MENQDVIVDGKKKDGIKVKIEVYDDIRTFKEKAQDNDSLLMSLNELLLLRNVQDKNIAKKDVEVVRVPIRADGETLRLMGVYLKDTMTLEEAQDTVLDMKLDSEKIFIINSETAGAKVFA